MSTTSESNGDAGGAAGTAAAGEPGAEQVSEERARRYAQYVAPTFVTLARRAVDLAEIGPGNTVLDLGTGTGLAAFLAAEKAGRDGSVIGLDPSPAMLKVAAERSAAVGYDFINWQPGQPAELSYADESFDAVLCVQALTLLPRPDAVLDEVRRVLVEGGRLVVTLWGSKGGNEWMSLLEEALKRAGEPAPPAPVFGLTHPGNLEVLLQAVSMEQIEVARVPDRMRFQGVEGFWQWSRAIGRWGAVLDALSPAGQERVRAALTQALAPRIREGEVAVNREIVYARAIAPAA